MHWTMVWFLSFGLWALFQTIEGMALCSETNVGSYLAKDEVHPNVVWRWIFDKNFELGLNWVAHGKKGIYDPSNTPGARSSSVGVAYKETFAIFGGSGYGELEWLDKIFGFKNDYGKLNDVWVFNLSSWEWVWVSGSRFVDQLGICGAKGSYDASNTPGARSSSVGIAHNGSFVIFGGYGYSGSTLGCWFRSHKSYSGTLNDVWELKLGSWEWRWISGSKLANQVSAYGAKRIWNSSYGPGGRYSSVGNSHNGTIIIFGGYGHGKSWALNDVWEFDLNSWNWRWTGGSKISDQLGIYGPKGTYDPLNAPGARGSMVGAVHRSTLVIFGGFGYSESDIGRLNDVWEFDLNSLEWRWTGGSKLVDQFGDYGTKGVYGLSNSPGARISSVGAVLCGNLVIFGGSGYNEFERGILNDVWEFDLSSWEWKWSSGSRIPLENSVHWMRGVYDRSNSPSVRKEALGIEWNGTLLIFGGWGHMDIWRVESYSLTPGGIDRHLNEVWQFEIRNCQT